MVHVGAGSHRGAGLQRKADTRRFAGLAGVLVVPRGIVGVVSLLPAILAVVEGIVGGRALLLRCDGVGEGTYGLMVDGELSAICYSISRKYTLPDSFPD